METVAGFAIGLFVWFFIRVVVLGIYTVNQSERAVKTSFGRAERLPGDRTTLDAPDLDALLRPEERERYTYPMVRVIPPGGPYFKMPWEKIHKISVATQTVSMALDPVQNLVLSAASKSVDTVIVDGEIVARGRRPTRVDEAHVYELLRQSK